MVDNKENYKFDLGVIELKATYCFLFILQYAAGVVTYPFVLVSHMMIVNNVGWALLYILNTNLKIKLPFNQCLSEQSQKNNTKTLLW